MPRKSFFERLTGAINVGEDDDRYYDDERALVVEDEDDGTLENAERENEGDAWLAEEAVGELPVDVYQTPDEIIVRTMVAGVRPDDLDVSITRESVTISGKREHSRRVEEEDFIHQELFWGSFARTIALPEEVEVDDAEASERHGLLTIRLPKINKGKQARLKIKTA